MTLFCLSYNDRELSLLSPVGSYSRVTVALPEGLVRVGRILDTAKFSQIITQAMSMTKPTRIRGNRVVVCLPEEQAFIKIIEMPGQLKDAELTSVLEHQWENFLPIPADQVSYDVYPLKPKGKRQKNSPQRVLVVAYPREIIANVIASITAIGAVPVTIAPLSFGLASLYGASDSAPTLVLQSTTGQDVLAAVIEQGVTHFSTTIHAPVGDPKCLRQIDNIRQYYEKNIGGPGSKVGAFVIVPTPYAPLLAQQVETFVLPTTVPPVDNYFGNDQQDVSAFLPLIGLVESNQGINILPESMIGDRLAKRQKTTLRSLYAIFTSLFIIATYLSLVYLGALNLNKRTTANYAQPLVTRVKNEESEIQKKITDFNKLASSARGVVSATTKSGRILETTLAISQSTLQIESISYDHTTKILSVTTKETDSDTIASFTAKILAHPYFKNGSVAQTSNSAEFTVITISGGGV